MKKILVLLLVISLGSGISFGYLEPNMFCHVNKQDIKVSLNAQDGSKCLDYISYIEQSMKALTRNLMVIQGYIVNGQDVTYWQMIKQQKLSEIDKLQAIRLGIITSMKAFESNLLQKTVQYFLQNIAGYTTKLQNAYTALTSYTGTITTDLAAYKTLLSSQLHVIDQISKVKTIPEIIPLMTNYVYLKQQLAGKSE